MSSRPNHNTTTAVLQKPAAAHTRIINQTSQPQARVLSSNPGLSPLHQVAPHIQPVPYHGTLPFPILADIEAKPWKYQGYPGFCKFAATSGDAFVLRRFNKLNVRVLLSMQDQIVQYENDLDNLDEKCRAGGEATECSSSLRNDPQPRRAEIIKLLCPLLREYNDHILSYSELRTRSSAQKFQVQNVENWFENNPHAIEEDEQKYIKTEDDLIPIIAESKSWMRLGIEKISPAVLRRVFPARATQDRLNNDHSFYVNNKAMDATMTFIIVTLGLAILLGPLWWLNQVSEPDTNTDKRLWIITGFVIFFTAVLASATVRKPFEVLVGTAGYAAVLMVFMQMQSPSNPTC